MGVGRKPDFPPLLPPGRHIMTLEDLKMACVDAYLDNLTRRNLFHNLEAMYQDCLVANIPCEFWVDGSFICATDNPGDVDVTVMIDQDVLESLTPHQYSLYERAAVDDYAPGIQSFAFARLSREHPNFGTEMDFASYTAET